MAGEDCTTFPATRVQGLTGLDPAAGLRGTYTTLEEANAIVSAAGGMERFVASRLEPLGFKRIQQPNVDDVGIVEVLTGFDPNGATVKKIPALYFGPCNGGCLWAVMSMRGPQVKKLNHSIAWRIA